MIYPGADWFSLQTDKESIPNSAPVFPGAAWQGRRQTAQNTEHRFHGCLSFHGCKFD
jgi:hypothetical protein